MEQVEVPDKVMTYITLFCSGHGYYPHFVEYPHFVDIIHILWILSAWATLIAT